MEFNHISKEESNYIGCIIYLVEWNGMSRLAKPIHNHKDRVKFPLGLGRLKIKFMLMSSQGDEATKRVVCISPRFKYAMPL